MNINLADLFLILFVMIDDWHQLQYPAEHQAGRPSELSDSEVLTLMVGMDFVEFSSERHYVAFIHANYKELFPGMLEHSQYNRRARALLPKVEHWRKTLFKQLGGSDERYRLIDTTPVPVVGYYRTKRHSEFLGSADYGYCAARKLRYYGYKLVLECTLSGIPGHIELVPANTDERVAADEIVDRLPVGVCMIGDKGFIDAEWQHAYQTNGITWLTPRRKNQKQPLPEGMTQLINKVRERIEGLYKVLKEGGRSLEKTLAHTVEGLCCRVVAKITSVTARYLLRKNWGIDVLTFSAFS